MGEGMLSLSWNNHSSTFCHMLSSLREKERYTDVTVTCEGKFYPVHKLVLSTCSDYFMKMFERTPCKHPIIVLKDIHCKEIEALLSYMYDGVVSVAQNDLSQLIKAAELLQIKGLAVPDEPPSSSRKAQNARNSADGRISPNPKRHKRDQGEVQNIFQSSPKSPFHQEKDQTQDASLSPRLPNKSEQAGDKDKTMASEGQKYQACPRQEQVEDAYHNQEISLHDNQGVEQHHIIKDSPNSDSEIMVDETLIKEEILDSSNESDIPDPALDYNSLGPDLGPDSGGGMEDNMNLDLAASFDHSDGHAYDSEAGPSGLQGWSVLNESGQGSAQDYCTEMNQDVSLVGQYRPLPQEQQQQHDLVPTNTEAHMFVEEDATVPEKTYHPVDILNGRQLYNHDTTNERLPNGSNQAIEGQHMLLMSQPKPYSCKWCSFTCSKRCDLKRHLRIHTGERPFKCHICPAQFLQNIHLKDHMHIHTGEKPYSCPLCSFRCANNSSLHRHVKTHTEKRPYSCEHCPARFAHKRLLKQHICSETNIQI
ncbi:zinc finger and SCAN domain-containing protein 2-like isoform X2 [Penaeus chinensis]|nr:zinc finger and SCAN domain-containing protein 2-like isoform X2 [Penaeus chinensis]XP_047492182.1 zinc finger and SCAN domain-containing protein 2-like isoform X2 [Penaeus chinensis]XP_047492183.1 zinc finger and SCAN domain-containing protein 2-like isoform X2 [Penaeus chinensis]